MTPKTSEAIAALTPVLGSAEDYLKRLFEFVSEPSDEGFSKRSDRLNKARAAMFVELVKFLEENP